MGVFSVCYMRFLACHRNHYEPKLIVVLQAILRLTETLSRKILAKQWHKRRGTAPSGIYVTLVTVTTMGAEVSQLAGFLTASASKHPVRHILFLMCINIVIDLFSR